MSKPPDIEALARRYVELWQDQISATAKDPELLDGLARTMQLLSDGAAASATLWQSAWSSMMAAAEARAGARNPARSDAAEPQIAGGNDVRNAPENAGQSGGGVASPGPAPATAAPAERGNDVADLEARIALLEERLRGLEGGSGRASSGTRPGRRGRRAR